ncbi:MAG: hypothetical protein ACOX7P_05555 [Oscillospiraceae bacterium]|jgi:hypothetical protein
MKYEIVNFISQEQTKLLRELKDEVLNSIFLIDAGEFALDVILNCSNVKLTIKNNPTVELDGDEYPRLVVEKSTVDTRNHKEIIVEKKIKNILIVRDEATWNNNKNNWLVHSDIGIKIILEDTVWMFFAHDSLAGLIKLIELKEHSEGENVLLEDYWTMKTDSLEVLKRVEISVD